MADIKESNDPQPSGGCMTALQLLQERCRDAMERHYHDFEKTRHLDQAMVRDIQDR